MFDLFCVAAWSIWCDGNGLNVGKSVMKVSDKVSWVSSYMEDFLKANNA